VPINFEHKNLNLPKKNDYYQKKKKFIKTINKTKNDFVKLFGNIIF